MNALNPVRRVGDQIAEPIEIRLGQSRDASRKRATELLDLVGIPKKRVGAYPHELSGGMRQRAMIAMALACDPGDRDRRRADDRAGRHGPGPDPPAAGAAAARPGAVAHPDHARPLGHRRDLRSRDGDVRRPRRGGGPGAARVHGAAAPIHTEAAVVVPQHPRRSPDARGRSRAACPTHATRRPGAGSRRGARSRWTSAGRSCPRRCATPTAFAWRATCTPPSRRTTCRPAAWSRPHDDRSRTDDGSPPRGLRRPTAGTMSSWRSTASRSTSRSAAGSSTGCDADPSAWSARWTAST